MAHKAICHVLTHWATETSLASCLAARDNRLPVLVPVPVDGECRLCCCPCMCMCVCACVNVRREQGVCLWVLWAVKWLNSLTSSFCLSVFCIRNVIWRCCSDPFLHRGGNSLHKPVALYSSGYTVAPTVTEQSLYSQPVIPRTHDSLLQTKRTKSAILTDVTDRKGSFYHERFRKKQLLHKACNTFERNKTQHRYHDFLCLFLYMRWGQ